MNKKAIVFDWDGTLMNSMPYKRKNFVQIISRFGVDEKQVLRYHLKHSGIPRKQLFCQALSDLAGKSISDQEYDELSQEYTLMNIKQAAKANLFPDALDILPKLRERGLRLFVSSSSAPSELQQVVDSLNVKHYFTQVMGSEKSFNKGPEHMEHICQAYQLTKEETLFIGDDEKDSYLASLVPMDCLRIDRENKLTLDHKIENLNDLLSILQF